MGGSDSARRPFLDSHRGIDRWPGSPLPNHLTGHCLDASTAAARTQLSGRLRSLQGLGIICGFAAGAWLGAAEAPTKLVAAGISPMVVSLGMVVGVFLARWTVPTLIQGTSDRKSTRLNSSHVAIS